MTTRDPATPDPAQPDPAPQPDPQVTAPDPAPAPGQSPAELREHAKRQEDAAKAMRQELMQERLEKIGLSHESGVGKAIYNHYDGDDVSVDGLATYAESEYGHKRPETQNPATTQVTTGSQRADALANQSVPTTPSQAPNEADQIAADMLDPEKVNRPLVERSIKQKISDWVSGSQNA